MTGMGWVLVAAGLVACGGKYGIDSSTTQGGSTTFGGTSSSGASPAGESGSGSSANAACLTSGTPPASQVTFSFESDQPCWMRYGCDVDYVLSKVCGQVSVPVQPQAQNPCSQPCASGKCISCLCDGGVVQVDQSGGPVGPRPQGGWRGFIYTTGVLSSGCACDDAVPAGSGTYAVTATAYLTREDALAQVNGYSFTTTFEYPPPDDIVYVRMDFKSL